MKSSPASAFDFPINKYVPAASPNSDRLNMSADTRLTRLPNNPVEFLVGVKIYPARWWGFGAWYRRALNDQRLKNFNGVNFNVPIANITNVCVTNPPHPPPCPVGTDRESSLSPVRLALRHRRASRWASSRRATRTALALNCGLVIATRASRPFCRTSRRPLRWQHRRRRLRCRASLAITRHRVVARPTRARRLT